MANGIRLDGDFRKLQRALKNLSEVELRGLNKVVGQDLKRSTIKRFKTQKDPEGKTWSESRSANEEGRKVLTDSARLRNSIKVKTDKRGIAVGTNTIYAKTHQYGAKNRRIRARNGKKLKFKVNGSWRSKDSVKVTIPDRPFLGISGDDVRNIKNTMNDFIENTMEN